MANLSEGSDGKVRVEVELGFTKSMGEGTYEFLRVDIRQGYEAKPGDDLSDLENFAGEMAERIYSSLEEALVARVMQIDEELGPKSRASSIHARG